MPSATQNTMPDYGVLPGQVFLNPKLAPRVRAGLPRPFAPGEYVQNPNGSWSSEITVTVQNPDGSWSVVPSLWLDNGKPTRVDEDTAERYAAQSGLPFRKFSSESEAEAFSNRRENAWQGISPQNASSVPPLWGSIMPDSAAAPALPQGDPNTDALVQSLMAKFGTPPSAPNLIPFQQAKDRIRAQQQALTPPPEPTLAPTPTNVPPPQITDPIKAMSPGLLVLAGLAGAVGGGITSAAENLTGFVNGIKSGDATATKAHLDEFNTQLKAALAQNQTAIDQYKLRFDKYGADADKLKSELASIADSENDAVLKHSLDMGDFNGAWKIIEGRQKQQELLQNRQEVLNLRMQGSFKPAALMLKDGTVKDGFYSPYMGYQDAEGNAIPSTDVAHFYPGVPSEGIITGDTAKRAAEMAVDKGDFRDAVASAGGFGNVGNINRGIIANEITRYAQSKNMSGADIAGKIAQFHENLAAATTTGHIAGATAQGAQEIQQFVPVINDLSQKIDRTQFPTLNSIELAVRKGTGDPQVVAFNSYIQSAKNAYALVMTRGGRSTDAARHRADELLSPNLSVDQVATALQAMSLEASIAQTSATRATQEVTGQPVTAPTAADLPKPDNDPYGLR